MAWPRVFSICFEDVLHHHGEEPEPWISPVIRNVALKLSLLLEGGHLPLYRLPFHIPEAFPLLPRWKRKRGRKSSHFASLQIGGLLGEKNLDFFYFKRNLTVLHLSIPLQNPLFLAININIHGTGTCLSSCSCCQ